jgi:hypothetical protein
VAAPQALKDGVGLRRGRGPVNLLPSHAPPTIPTVSYLEDPPTPRAVVRGFLGIAAVVAAVALVVVSLVTGHIEWRLVALGLALWSAYGFWDAMLGGVFEPLGEFLGDQLTGGSPGAPVITIEQETASLEHLLAAHPPLPPHRAILVGIRLAEIYRTHQRNVPKSEALIARLAAQYPNAPELKYVHPGSPPAAGD